ncbi:hypothetical protein TNCV_1421341 [Trichonephila clavipes]|nr:hypothetical protein TNCV_1421341 [Trichonephila clavipes]
MRIHRLGPGSNPQPWVQKASDKPTTPPSRGPLRHGGTLNSRRAASPLVRLVEGEERWKTPDPTPRVFSL